ncbi:unnamed protein product [Didymodactylos carnosus]|uniref:Uncharacterized protein n=1 Tax=Didymodactylos carnosus TaxID=1234261 RepID=A0A8S2HTD1_9BILA|nr:unnamed protein product [Didymodactylos carnosus]CAF3684039.1 unnamed protein product [Didymodactylos carnosus]
MSDEKEMVLKVLHQYLDECKVAFVAIANKVFDPANANRMICVYRSLPSKKDQEILAYGCYRRVLDCDAIPKIFHDRDFIYMLRELRFGPRSTATYSDATVDEITPESSLCALQDNFNGIKYDEFKQLTEIFFKAIQEKCPIFELPTNNSERNVYRDVTTILRESMPLTSIHRRLYGRYKLIIDESEDESVVRLLFQTKILDPNRTTIFRLSDFPDDVDNELRNVEILSTIKLCIEIDKIAQLLCNNYFRQQEHFSLENFIRQLVTKSLSETQNDDGETMNRTTDESSRAKNVLITTKVMIYTRTLSYVMSLNKLSKFRLLGNNNNADYEIISGMTNILSLTVSENAAELEQKFHAYEQDRDKHVLIIVINARLTQQRRNIPFVRQLVDRTENGCN